MNDERLSVSELSWLSSLVQSRGVSPVLAHAIKRQQIEEGKEN